MYVCIWVLSIFACKSKTMENPDQITPKACKSSKSTLLHALRTVGGGIANNLNDTSQLPHLADFFSLAISYNLWTHRGVTTLQLHVYIVDPAGTVTARDSANSQTCWKWGNVWNLRKLHTLVEIIEFLYFMVRVLQGHVLENATFAFIKKIHLFKVYFPHLHFKITLING